MQDLALTTPLSESLSQWRDFYALLGTAAATLVGLMFVAVSVGTGVFSMGRRAPLRIFLSASMIHFSAILAVCLITMVPMLTWGSLGALIGACGLFGLAYYALTWRDILRDGILVKIDLEDRTWYTILPVIGYAFETASGAAIAERMSFGCAALAFSVGALLIVGLHNAWDITIWIVARPRETNSGGAVSS